MRDAESEGQRIQREFMEGVEPIHARIEDDLGTFALEEQDDGTLAVTVSFANEKEYDLAELLPEGWSFVGNKELYGNTEKHGIGYPYPLDDSFADTEAKSIALAETIFKQEGWRFLLIALHEVGHARMNAEDPEKYEAMNRALNDKFRGTPDEKFDKTYEYQSLVAQDERDAWAYALREFRRLCDDAGIDPKRILPDKETYLEVVYANSLLGKAYTSAGTKLLELSDEEKQKYESDLVHMYTRWEKAA